MIELAKRFFTIMAERDEKVARGLQGYPPGTLHSEWGKLSQNCADVWWALAGEPDNEYEEDN